MGKVSAHKKMTGGFVKSFVCEAREPGKAEVYFSYVEPFPGKAQTLPHGLFTKPSSFDDSVKNSWMAVE